MKLTDLNDPQYVALETFKKNGDAVNTPVWVIEENTNLYVWTPADSWKVKRIRNNPRVRLAISDSRGNPTGEWMEAQAKVVDDPAAEPKIRNQLVKKYGLFARLIRVYNALFQRGKTAAVLEISDV